MNKLTQTTKIVRLALSLMAVLAVWVSQYSQPAKASTDKCSCVDYVVEQVFQGHPKGTSEQFRGSPYNMAIKADGRLARTGETSVYWSWDDPNDNYYHRPRYNAGWAQAGDVVILLAGEALYAKDIYGNYYRTSVPRSTAPGGHIAIVNKARYYPPQQDPTGQGTGGWEIEVRHANWSHCDVTTDTLFVPNGTSTSWWREY